MKNIKLKQLKNISKFIQDNEINLFDIEVGELYLKVEKKGFDKFVMEKPYENIISVAFYSIQNGDCMVDPEICLFFDKINDEVVLVPYSFQNSYVGYYKELLKIENGKVTGYLRGGDFAGTIRILKDMDNSLGCMLR